MRRTFFLGLLLFTQLQAGLARTPSIGEQIELVLNFRHEWRRAQFVAQQIPEPPVIDESLLRYAWRAAESRAVRRALRDLRRHPQLGPHVARCKALFEVLAENN